MRDFLLLPRCLRSSGLLRSAEWEFLTYVSRQPVGPDFLPLKMVPTGCFETSVRNYPSALRNSPDERSYNIELLTLNHCCSGKQ